jgi:hypothetical protein
VRDSPYPQHNRNRQRGRGRGREARGGGGGCVARVQAEAAPPSPEHGPSCNRTDVFRRCALGTKGRGDNSRRMKREGVPLPQANLPTQQHHGTRPRKGKWQRCRGKAARAPGKGQREPGRLEGNRGGGGEQVAREVKGDPERDKSAHHPAQPSHDTNTPPSPHSRPYPRRYPRPAHDRLGLIRTCQRKASVLQYLI